MQDHELTPTQQAFLKMYRELELEHGEGPSIRKMATAWGYSDHSGAQQMMNKLADMGYIRLAIPVPGGTTEKAKRLLGK